MKIAKEHMNNKDTFYANPNENFTLKELYCPVCPVCKTNQFVWRLKGAWFCQKDETSFKNENLVKLERMVY